MGNKLVRIFEIVTEQAGLTGRLALASKMGVSMAKAAAMKDSEELIKSHPSAHYTVIP